MERRTPAGEPPVEWHDAVESTQDLAHAVAEGGAPHGTALAARVQTRGRGTRGRQWRSGEGGLWLSVVLRPTEVAGVELLSLRIGLSLAETLARESESRVDPLLKWPNDLYLGDRKLGGILVEARWQGETPAWVAVGIGLNLTNELPSDAVPPATRTEAVGWAPEPRALGPIVARAVLEAAGRTGPLEEFELAAFSIRDWLRGRRTARPVAGLIVGIAASGRLLLAGDDGEAIELLDSQDLALER
jgi:BirA family biotin operon repressor/biotin-[acetyl-CoA-carboxylase] ligase